MNIMVMLLVMMWLMVVIMMMMMTGDDKHEDDYVTGDGDHDDAISISTPLPPPLTSPLPVNQSILTPPLPLNPAMGSIIRYFSDVLGCCQGKTKLKPSLCYLS